MPESRPQIFAFASNEWHTPWWMARQHFFTRLARRGWPVIYSTGPQSIWERETEKWRSAGLFHKVDVASACDGSEVLVDRPGKFLPMWKGSGAWHNFVVGRHAKHLEKRARHQRGGRRIAYLWNPRFWPYINRLDPDYVVFHIHDSWDVSTWSAPHRRNLTDLAARADLIISTAENMSRHLPGIGPGKARILPHGVDVEAVQSGQKAPCPADLVQIPRPRIGYTGRVNLKLDFPMIIDAAMRRPDWHWVFVGATGIGTSYSFEGRPSVKADWEQLNHLPNVHFLGVKDRDDVPAYLQNFDVLSLPFSASYVGLPTKLLEYFASGKPTISWRGENVLPLSHLINIADGPDEWIAAIDAALSGAGNGTAAERIAFARAGDWNAQTATLEGWLEEMLRRPSRRSP
jgi:glycosyltransferase involved in cell wall biosynthesis